MSQPNENDDIAMAKYCETQYVSLDYNNNKYVDPDSPTAYIYDPPFLFTKDACSRWFSKSKQVASVSFEKVCRKTGGRVWLSKVGDTSKLGYNKNLPECGCILAYDEAAENLKDLPVSDRIPPECMDARCKAEWKTYSMEKTECNIVDCKIIVSNSKFYGNNQNINMTNKCGKTDGSTGSGGSASKLTKNQIGAIVGAVILLLLMVAYFLFKK
jgi:hypothetical protein